MLDISVLQKYFKEIYASKNRYASEFAFSPNHTFIDLLYVLHENPIIKTHSEVHSKAMIQQGGNADESMVKKIHSQIYTIKKLNKIFDFCSETSSIYLVEGAPGIGKTMVAKEIAFQWAVGKILPNIKLLLLIFFRDPGIYGIKNFVQLMQYCYNSTSNQTLASKIAQHFEDALHGEGLMIIFDGFDECPLETNCRNLFYELLHKRILPKCCVVVTSRSHITADLLQYCNYRVEIFGFTEADRSSYLKKCLSPQQYDNVSKYLQQHPIIDSLCYIPLNMVNFTILAENNESLPTTQSELAEKSIKLIITRHNEKHKSAQKMYSTSDQQEEHESNIKSRLAKLAYKMIKQEKLVTIEKQIKKVGLHITDDHNIYGLLQSVQFHNYSVVSQQRSYNFMHFSIQEYLAAYHVAHKFSMKKIIKLKSTFWEPKYLGMWKMYVGITKGEQFEFKQFLSGESYVKGAMRHFLKLKFPGISEKISINKVKCLQLYQIFLEAPGSEIRKSISTIVKDDSIDLSGSDEHFSFTDINILSHFITKSYITMNWVSINLSNCGIDNNGCQILLNGLLLEDGRKKPTLQCLKLSHNKISKLTILIHLVHVCKIKCLVADHNLIQCTMNDCISYQNFTDSKLESINLSYNSFTSEDVIHLCDILLKHKQLNLLQLKGISLCKRAKSALLSLFLQLNYFENIECDDNGILSSIIQPICKGKVEFDNVDCIHNFITVANKIIKSNSRKYIEYLSNISVLTLKWNDKENFLISSFDFLLWLSCLSKLDLSGIKLHENVCNGLIYVFKNNVSSFQTLIMNSCGITTTSVMNFMLILKNATNMCELQLCNNLIDDDATEVLALSIFHWCSFRIFKYDYNYFTRNSIALFNLLLCDLHQDEVEITFNGELHSTNIFATMLQHADIDSPAASRFVANVQNASTLNISLHPRQVSEHLNTDQVLKMFYNQAIKKFYEMLPNIFKYIKEFVKLSELNFSGIIINNSLADVLAVAFENNLRTTLNILNLSKCELQSTTFVKLVKKLKCIKVIKKIKISHNHINEEALEELLIAIVHWDSLETLNFEYNQFDDFSSKLLDFLIDFHKDICNSSYTRLHFNDLQAHFLLKVLSGIENVLETDSNFVNKILKLKTIQLNAFDNPVELDIGVPTFFHRFTNLNILVLIGIIVNNDAFNTSFVKNLPNLQCLIVDSCQLKSETAIGLLQNLQHVNNLRLQELQLNNNLICDRALELLVFAFLTWGRLKILSVENNKLSKNSVALLNLMIRNDYNIPELTLHDDLHYRCFQAILQYIVPHYAKSRICLNNIQKITTLYISVANLCLVKHFQIDYFINLKALIIQGLYFDENAVNNFITALTVKKTIRINSKGIIITCDVPLEMHCLLEILSLKNCHISSASVRKLLQNVPIMKNIKELDLSCNEITDEAIPFMISKVLQMPCLTYMNLDDNKFERYRNIQKICEISMFLKVTSNIHLQTEDCIAAFLHLTNVINDILENNLLSDFYTSIEILSLQNLSEKLIIFTSSASLFLQKSVNLIELNLFGIFIDLNSVTIISEGLSNKFHSLQKLSLVKCGLNCESVNKLLTYNKPSVPIAFQTLQEINLNDNHITDDVISTLAKSYLHMPNLRKQTSNMEHRVIFKLILFYLKRSHSKIEFKDVNNNEDKSLDYVPEFLTLMDIMHDVSEKRSLQVKNCISVKELTLCYSHNKKLRPKLTNNAAKFLETFICLNQLNFSGICIEPSVVATFTNALTRSKNSLSILSLNHCQLDYCAANGMKNFLNNNTVLTELNLANNKLDGRAAVEIVKELANCKRLKKFDLSCNKITDEAIPFMISKVLQMPCLTYMNLDDNKFERYRNIQKICEISMFLKVTSNIHLQTEDCIAAFLHLTNVINDILENNLLSDFYTSIEILSLQNLSEKLIIFTSSASLFLQKSVNLIELNLFGIFIDLNSVTIISEGLSNKFHSLQKLSLVKCGLNCESVNKLLTYNKPSVPIAFQTLQEINLNDNHITDDVISTLAKSYLHMPNLRKQTSNMEHRVIFKLILFYLKRSHSKIEFKDVNNNEDKSLDYVPEFLTLMDIMHDVSEKRSLQVKNCISVKELTLCYSHNKKLRPKLTNNAAKFLETFICLNQLNFSGICIEPSVVATFTNALTSSKNSLSILSLNYCQLDCCASNGMKNFLNNNTVLTELNLSNNKLDGRAAVEIAGELANCKRLKKFYISFNNITDEAAIPLRDLMTKLYQHGNLIDIDFSDNNLSNQSMSNIYFAAGWTIWTKYKLPVMQRYI